MLVDLAADLGRNYVVIVAALCDISTSYRSLPVIIVIDLGAQTGR